MFRRLFTVKPAAWWLLLTAAVVAVAPRLAWQLKLVDSHDALYIVQPVAALIGALLARYLLHGQKSRLRHTTDKAFVVGSVLSVWFVLYFMSGLFLTFVHNAVASSWQAVGLNIISFGASVLALEFMRYSLMVLAGRRNLLWFGVLVSVVCAIQQIGLILPPEAGSFLELLKFGITYILPAGVMSLLLTYLSVAAGFGPQLVYGLGVIAAAVLPPIIPKYDWYMTSMSSVLLAVAVYMVVDRSGGGTDAERLRRRHRRPRLAFDAMFGVFTVALVCFMTGVFTYKPVVIMSNSMLPVFSRGSVVVVQQLRGSMDIQVGDIIQYEAEHKTITHRVVAIDTAEDDSGDRVFTTKGDNNKSRDEPVAQSRVIGIVRSTIPYAGYPTVWLHDISAKH